jgi:hypothetical protein
LIGCTCLEEGTGNPDRRRGRVPFTYLHEQKQNNSHYQEPVLCHAFDYLKNSIHVYESALNSFKNNRFLQEKQDLSERKSVF